MNIFHEDFLDFFRALNNNKVAYLLVSGYSVIIHGYSRTTGDLDIWVKSDQDNYGRLMAAFLEFHLPTSAFTLADFLDTDKNEVFTFGRPPIAIDILTKVKGLDFEQGWDSSGVHNIQEVPVRVIHFQHLLKTKMASGRHRDLDDIEHLTNNLKL